MNAIIWHLYSLNVQKRLINLYETFSAYQTHTALWIFGWIVDTNTAVACFNKQFHIHNSLFSPTIKADITIQKAKRKLLSGKAKRIRLTWRRYNTKASIYLNGSYLSIYHDDKGKFFLYEIPVDYKPGIIDIGGIKLSETVFDYLENKGILSVYTEHCFQKT